MRFHRFFKIIKIEGVISPVYGQCVMVYANAVGESASGCPQFITHLTSYTYRIIFRASLMPRLVELAENYDIWAPISGTYMPEIMRFNDKKKTVFVHDSLWELYCYWDGDEEKASKYPYPLHNIELFNPTKPEPLEFDDPSCVIHSLSKKFDIFVCRYMKEKEHSDDTLLDFYDTLTENDPNFYAWLFDDKTLVDKDEVDLSDTQSDAIGDFISDLDKYIYD